MFADRLTTGAQVSNSSVRWPEFFGHWSLWSVYIAHFSMNWSNYIVMQWLPTYMARTLGAEKHAIMLTAVPYIMNSLVGVGRSSPPLSPPCRPPRLSSLPGYPPPLLSLTTLPPRLPSLALLHVYPPFLPYGLHFYLFMLFISTLHKSSIATLHFYPSFLPSISTLHILIHSDIDTVNRFFGRYNFHIGPNCISS